jgi:hypothetical protein
VRWFTDGSGAATMPYDVLRPSRFGATGVAVAVVVLHGIALGLAAALLTAHAHVRKRRALP